jgi:hypothetical protein
MVSKLRGLLKGVSTLTVHHFRHKRNPDGTLKQRQKAAREAAALEAESGADVSKPRAMQLLRGASTGDGWRGVAVTGEPKKRSGFALARVRTMGAVLSAFRSGKDAGVGKELSLDDRVAAMSSTGSKGFASARRASLRKQQSRDPDGKALPPPRPLFSTDGAAAAPAAAAEEGEALPARAPVGWRGSVAQAKLVDGVFEGNAQATTAAEQS